MCQNSPFKDSGGCYNLLLMFITKASPKMQDTRMANDYLCRFVRWRKKKADFHSGKKVQNW